MKSFVCAVLTVIFMAGPVMSELPRSMAPPVPVGSEETLAYAPQDESPCDDPKYVELKTKKLEEMTEREYEYFKRKDAECAEYRRLMLMQTPTTPSERPIVIQPAQQPAEQDKGGISTGATVALAVLATLGTLLIIGALAAN